MERRATVFLSRKANVLLFSRVWGCQSMCFPVASPTEDVFKESIEERNTALA